MSQERDSNAARDMGCCNGTCACQGLRGADDEGMTMMRRLHLKVATQIYVKHYAPSATRDYLDKLAAHAVMGALPLMDAVEDYYYDNTFEGGTEI